MHHHTTGMVMSSSCALSRDATRRDATPHHLTTAISFPFSNLLLLSASDFCFVCWITDCCCALRSLLLLFSFSSGCCCFARDPTARARVDLLTRLCRRDDHNVQSQMLFVSKRDFSIGSTARSFTTTAVLLQ